VKFERDLWSVIYLSVLFIAASSCATSTHAALISASSAFGTDTVTRDSGTGLDWLDLTLTQAQSFNDVTDQFDPGELYAGFRHATLAEIETFWTNAGVSLPAVFPALVNLGPVRDLLALLGQTFVDASGNVLGCGVHGSGFTANSSGTFHNTGCIVATLSGGQAIPGYDVQNDAERGRELTGHWLVRATPVETNVIPEPSTAYLLCVAGVIVLTRKHLSGGRRDLTP
tara:strand:+ start:283 stop:963 length:681 start_codon:yes stop_codon:yes gene_type:complete